MKDNLDVHEVIGEQANSLEEQRHLEEIAEVLDKALQSDVPYRPEFKEELREHLLVEARRTLLPWYRRPRVWVSSLAVAAAALVALGLSSGAPWSQGSAPQVAEEDGESSDGVNSYEHSTTPRLTSEMELPVVHLSDEILSDASVEPEPVTDVDPSAGVPVYLIRNGADLDQFQRVAANLGITGKMQQSEDGYWVGSGDKRLTMSADGHIVYADAAPTPLTGEVMDEADAREAAYRFLNRAALPVPDLQPAVAVQTESEGQQVYQVTYTPRLEGRPVVNGRTVVWMTDRSGVFRAEAYLHAREETIGSGELISPEEAVALAIQAGGGQFGPAADLVYVRAASDGSVYFEPQWRVFGQDEGGNRVVRYISALAHE